MSMRRFGPAALSITFVTGALPVIAADLSTLRPGDALVLMPAAAHLSEDGREWMVPLHAWVYLPQSSRVRRAAIEQLLALRYGLAATPASAPHLATRLNLLLADNKRGRRIVVDVGTSRFNLPPTGPNGHAEMLARVPVSATAKDGGRLTIRAALSANDKRRIETNVHLIGPTGTSVISDIDDTVKVTGVTDHRRMFEATFYKPFEAVAGMPDAYRQMSTAGVPFHYVSSSPWHFATPLLDFMATSGLPISSLALKQIRLKDRTALDIVKPGRKTKPPQIQAILARYPQRQFILIGDSGEDDPEIYAAAMRQHGARITRVFIRNVTGARRDDVRFKKAFAGIDDARWVLFDDPVAIAAK